MKEGQLIRLQAYGDKALQMIVVSEEGDTVYVCRMEEYEAAKTDNRDPKCVGFNRQFILQE